MSRVVTILLLVTLTTSVKLPSSFKKCNRKQSDLKKCVLEAVRDAIPQMVVPFKNIGTPGLNPLEIAKVTIKGGTGTVAVDQNFKNCKLYGLDKIDVEKFEFDFDKKTLGVIGEFPKIDMRCEYQMNGQVLLLPVQGEGPANIILHNLKSSCILNYEEVKKGGKTYFKFVASKLDMDPGLISFKFENLFNGEKGLGDNINKVLNENWKEVYLDVKDDYIELINQILLGLLNKFFNKVSMEEAFD